MNFLQYSVQFLAVIKVYKCKNKRILNHLCGREPLYLGRISVQCAFKYTYTCLFINIFFLYSLHRQTIFLLSPITWEVDSNLFKGKTVKIMVYIQFTLLWTVILPHCVTRKVNLLYFFIINQQLNLQRSRKSKPKGQWPWRQWSSWQWSRYQQRFLLWHVCKRGP